MNRIIAIILVLSLVSCKKSTNEGEIIPNTISICLDTISSTHIIDSIDLIPLETSSKSIIHGIKKILYIESENIFVILDKRNILTIFDQFGNFIINSEHIKGNGPNQYHSILDIAHNPYLGTIEILQVDSRIKVYSYDLDFLETRDISLNKGYIPKRFFPLDSVNYIISPTFNMDECLFFVNTNNRNVQQIYYDKTIANLSMDVNSFYKLEDKYYFIPNGINYYIYEIDSEKKAITPKIYLDFGKYAINKKTLPHQNNYSKGRTNEQDKVKLITNENINSEYLLESNEFLPIIKFFNKDYIYIHAIRNRKPYNYIYNRNNGKTFIQSINDPLPMKFCLGIFDNILYTYVQPYEVIQYVPQEFLSDKTQNILNQIEEEDNIVIIKYVLR